MRIRSLPVAVATILVAVLALSGCGPSGDRQISATGATVTTEFPDLNTAAADAGRAAMEVMPGDYLMLRPAELTAATPIPPEGLTLHVTLPAALPDGALARFAFFDDELGVWVPVETVVEGTRATAVVTHLSLWSIVITGAGDLLGEVAEAFRGAGAAMTEFVAAVGDEYVNGLKEWSVNGPGAWIYRQTGLLLGMQAAAPKCEGGPLPGWVESTVISKLMGIPEESQSVLRCVGVDPNDTELVQIKAVANRGYGFPIEFASGVVPKNMSWSVLEGVSFADISELLDVLADNAANGVFQDPRAFLSGTSEIAFSVSEADVRLVEEGQPLVYFPKASPGQAALSVLSKYVFDQTTDAIPGFVGLVLALNECDPHGLPLEGEPAEWIAYLLGCVETISDTEFQEKLGKFVTENATATDWPKPVAKLWEGDSVKLVRKALSALKWVDVVVLGLTLVDYLGERDDIPWRVGIVPVPRAVAVWEDVNGTWCDSGNAADCWTINLPTDRDGHPIEFGRAENGCFTGYVNYPEYEGHGDVFFYCPAGVPSLDRGGQRHNPNFDRMWRGPGIEPSTWFREDELTAATAG